jgi:hypothetical protein
MSEVVEGEEGGGTERETPPLYLFRLHHVGDELLEYIAP